VKENKPLSEIAESTGKGTILIGIGLYTKEGK